MATNWFQRWRDAGNDPQLAASKAKAQRVLASQPVRITAEDDEEQGQLMRIAAHRRRCHMDNHKRWKLCERCKARGKRNGSCSRCKLAECGGFPFSFKAENTGQTVTIFVKCTPEKCGECKEGATLQWERQKGHLEREGTKYLREHPPTGKVGQRGNEAAIRAFFRAPIE